MLEHLKTKGRQLIGWNEILAADNLDKTIIAQYWTPERDKNAEKHANSGGSIIMSNHKSFYFDMPYGKYPLKNTYDYSPERFGVNKQNIKNVLGVEGEVWTEWIDSAERLDMMLFPRLQALSEVAWSYDENKNWKSFLERLDSFKVLNVELKFLKGDTHLETRRNRKYIAKGEI